MQIEGRASRRRRFEVREPGVFARLSRTGRHSRNARRRGNGREIASYMPEVRRQATLFLSGVPVIENLRRTFDPRQSELIAAHVTLCREDEVSDWGGVRERLACIPSAVTLSFGSPVRDGDLVLLPGSDDDGSFRALRQHLLETVEPRDHKPHITIVHPRNARCSDAAWATICADTEPFTYTFREASLILQQDGGVWRTLENFPLK